MGKKEEKALAEAAAENGIVPVSNAADMLAEFQVGESAIPANFRAEIIVSLSDGQSIKGILGERGPDLEYADPDDEKRVSNIPTWYLDSPSGQVRVRLICGHQLWKQEFPKLKPGTPVFVQRTGQVPGRGNRRVTRYLVFAPTEK